MSLLVLVRHGQSLYNQENRFTGCLDIALTAQGREEARLAGIKLKNYQFDIAYSSMLQRALESLKIILDVLHQSAIEIVKNSALNERMYGSLQGLDKAKTILKYGAPQVDIWRRSYDICPPDGESLALTYDRVVAFYKTQIEPQLKNKKNVLIVAHGNSLRALMMYLENISHEAIASVNVQTGIPRVYNMDEHLKIKSVEYL